MFAEDGPIRMARAAKSLFEIRCKSTGEKLLGPVIEEVQGVYFEPDGGSHYDRIQGQGGVYSSSGSSILGEPMVNSGWLLFFERKNYRSSAPGETPALYTRHYLKDGKGQPVNDLESRYGVLARNLETEAEKKFGVHGVEIRIVDLKTDETIATTSYFISTRHRRFCGDAPDGNFSASSFVTRFSLVSAVLITGITLAPKSCCTQRICPPTLKRSVNCLAYPTPMAMAFNLNLPVSSYPWSVALTRVP